MPDSNGLRSGSFDPVLRSVRPSGPRMSRPTGPLVLAVAAAAAALSGCADLLEPADDFHDPRPVLEWRFDQVPVAGLEAVHVVGPDSVIAVGRLGTVLTFDGDVLRDISPPRLYLRFMDVWGTSLDDFFAVTHDNYIFRYEGGEWTSWEAPVGGDTQLYGVWGTSSTDVFVVGYGGDVFHFDGAEWTLMPTPTWYNLGAVFGFAPDDVWAVGTANEVLHYDGESWTHMDAPEGVKLMRGLWGPGPDELYAAGADGMVLHYDGTAWSRVDLGTEADFGMVWGTGSDDVYIAGYLYEEGELYHFDGTDWTMVGMDVPLTGVSGAAAGDVWLVAGDGTVLRRDGSTWTSVRGQGSADLYDVIGFDDGTVYAVGDNVVLSYTEDGWSEVVTDAGSPHYAAWGTGPADLFVMGGGINHLARLRNGSWNVFDVPGGRGTYEGVWGTSSADVYAVGSRLLHFDGSDWTVVMGTDPTYAFTGVWGAAHDDVYAVQSRADPRMIHFDGTGWQPVAIPDVAWSGGSGAPYLTDVWGTSADEVYAVGGPGVVLHFDGTEWTPMETGTSALLLDIRGTSPVDIYAVGEDCTILHYDGVAWEQIDPSVECRGALNGVWLDADSDVLIVGEAGTIIRGVR